MPALAGAHQGAGIREDIWAAVEAARAARLVPCAAGLTKPAYWLWWYQCDRCGYGGWDAGLCCGQRRGFAWREPIFEGM